MIKKKEKKVEFEIKFWEDWLNADLLKREEMVENLPIIKEIWGLKDMPENVRKHSFALMLNSFFEDLESAIYTKMRNSKRE